jgi:hypothetical protein
VTIETDILGTGLDARMAYALPAVRTGRCEFCKSRILGADVAIGTCELHRNGPAPIQTWASAIPDKYQWARLEQPIRPPDWARDVPLIHEAARRKVIDWCDGKFTRTRNRLAILSERADKSETGTGKTSLVAAAARRLSSTRRLPIMWVHASELRGDQSDKGAVERLVDRMIAAPLLVIDGIGAELGGATTSKGWQEARVAQIRDWATRMYEGSGIVLSTRDLSTVQLVASHGADFVRRIGTIDERGREENATIIML